MQPAALPAPDEPGTWDDLNNRMPRTAHGSHSRRHIIGLPAGQLKDASGAATRPGCARSLTCPAARHRHRQLPGNGRRQSRMPTQSHHNPKIPAQTPLDTAPLLQG